jgi:glycosyltransferase involved in cell wall biosynthesis/MoaA/NifB/PqqE/SkfB family radical SAM enzyme
MSIKKKSSKPLVSVIIPVYNSSYSIENCLESVFEQNYPNFEVIVVDDGSTDDSANKIAKFEKVKYIYLHNGGVAKARNKGARIAQGKYYYFLDSDVIITPDTVSEFVRTAHENDADLVLNHYSLKPMNNKLVHHFKAIFDFVRSIPPEHKDKILKNVQSSGGGDFYSAKAFQKLLGYDEKFSGASIEREEMWLRFYGLGFNSALNLRIFTRHYFPSFSNFVRTFKDRIYLTIEMLEYRKKFAKHLTYLNIETSYLAPLLSGTVLIVILLSVLRIISPLIVLITIFLFLLVNRRLITMGLRTKGLFKTIQMIPYCFCTYLIIFFYGSVAKIKVKFKRLYRTGLFPLLKNLFFSKDPFFLVLFVTSQCNARCKMCFNWENIENWKSRKEEELDLKEIEKITKKLNSIQQLTIGGGEPFLRKDLAEVCSLFAKNSGVQWITIPTNGLLPGKIREILPKMLSENATVHFRICLATSEINKNLDDLYQVKGAWEKHQETFRILSEIRIQYPNLSIDCNVVYSNHNQETFRKCIDYIVKNMPDANPLAAVVRGNPKEEKSSDINVEALKSTYQYLLQIPKISNRPFGIMINVMRDIVYKICIKALREKQRVVPCRCGNKLLVIYDNGDIHPCELLPNAKFGNIRDYDYDIKKVIETMAAKNLIKTIRNSCFCTWETSNYNNIIFSWKYRIKMLWKSFLYTLGRDPSQTNKH